VSSRIHFISDLHLTKDRPENTQRFLAYLASLSQPIKSLYILGDLFDVWIGDDDQTPPNNEIKQALRSVSDRGISIYFIAGNRDFLIGQQFFKETGITCLKDSYVIDLFGTKALLMHGDLLCTDDVQYQQFRQLTHQTSWQQDLLSKSLEERLAIAQHYRSESHLNKAEKSTDIMDVNQQAVIDHMEKTGVQLLIHGHTHRPAEHSLVVNNTPAKRIVLAEWDTDGSILEWTATGHSTLSLL